MNDESAGKRKHLVLLYCQHAVERDESVAVAAQNREDCEIRTMMVPCSSKVRTRELLCLLEEGASVVELVACPEGSCRFLIGSSRAEKRIGYAQSMLREIGENPGRLGITRASGLTAESLIDMALRRFERYRTAAEEGRNA